ncbi:Cyclin-D-binding Myb-like transcription factor 1-like protein [Drosera capensis]
MMDCPGTSNTFLYSTAVMKSEETVNSKRKKARKKEPNSLEVSEKDIKRKKRKVEGTRDTEEARKVANEADGLVKRLAIDDGLSMEKRKKDRDRTCEEKGHEEIMDHRNKWEVAKYSGTFEIEEPEVKKKKIVDLGVPDQDEDHHSHGELKETVERQEEEKKKKKKKKKHMNTDSREEELVPDGFNEQQATVDSARKLELKKERSHSKKKRHETGAGEDEGKETHDGVHSPRHVEGMSADVGKVVKKGEGEKERKKKKKRKRSETGASLEDEGLVNDDRVHSEGVQEKEEGDRKKRKKAKSKKDAIKTGAEVCELSGNSPPGRSAKKVKFSDQVEVFPLDASGDSAGNGLVQGKRFSPEEDELIKESVFDYINRHCLGEEGLQMLMHCSRHRELWGCWAEIGQALPWRPAPVVYFRAHILFERGEKCKWSEEELDLVKDYHNRKGACWKSLAVELGKHRVRVKDAWRRINVSNQKRGHWTLEELEKLYELVNMDLRMKAFADRKVKHGMLKDNISWGAISEKLSTRSNANCCLKWYDSLASSMVAEGFWADTDDYRLLMALYELDKNCEEDVDWDNLLDHRSGDLCRKRWRELARHIGNNRKRSFAEQIDVIYGRYCPDILEAKEAYNSKTPVDL